MNYRGVSIVGWGEYKSGCVLGGVWEHIYTPDDWLQKGFTIKPDQWALPRAFLYDGIAYLAIYHQDQTQPVKKATALVWWLTYGLVEAICVSEEKMLLPQYIQRHLDYMRGRPLNGRLWSDPMFGEVSAVWDKGFLSRLAADSGGLVIDPDDLPAVRQFGGFVTDLKMKGV